MSFQDSHFQDESLSQGVHHVAEPTANTERSFDIIALHGLGGHWERTWTSWSTDFCWLREVLPTKFASSRILSYNCPSLTQDLAHADADGLIGDLIYDRRVSGRSHRPILFVGHSLGGSLLKQIFVATHPKRNSRTDSQQLHRSIRAYVFLGTPQSQNVVQEDFAALQRALDVRGQLSSAENAKLLKQAFYQIPRINNDFRELRGETLPSYCFYEVEKTRVGIMMKHIVSKPEASIKSNSADCSPLNLIHQDLGRYRGVNDANLSRVLRGMENVLTRAEDPDFVSLTQPVEQPEGSALKLLSLDGGGVRGLFSIIVLEALLEEIWRLEGSRGVPKRPCEYFNLIGGTSTGGLLAIMLGRLQMDVQSCKQVYRNMSRDIFTQTGVQYPLKKWIDAAIGSPWFPAERLEEYIRQVVEDRLSLSEKRRLDAAGTAVRDAPLLSTDLEKGRCFVCAICDKQYPCERLRSYPSVNSNGRDTSSYTIWQAGRATSAAPLYFPPIEINSHHYFDGGMKSNNPILEVVDEAYLEFGSDVSIGAIVSIGTGMSTLVEPYPGILNVGDSFTRRVTNTQAQHDDFLDRRDYRDLHPIYFRFQEEGDLGNIDLAASDKIDVIEALAHDYVRSEEGRDMIEKCAARFVLLEPSAGRRP